jgi:hypothetical protein
MGLHATDESPIASPSPRGFGGADDSLRTGGETGPFAAPHLISFDDEFLTLQALEERARELGDAGRFRQASGQQRAFRRRLAAECARQGRLLAGRQAGEIAELQGRARGEMAERDAEHEEEGPCPKGVGWYSVGGCWVWQECVQAGGGWDKCVCVCMKSWCLVCVCVCV